MPDVIIHASEHQMVGVDVFHHIAYVHMDIAVHASPQNSKWLRVVAYHALLSLKLEICQMQRITNWNYVFSVLKGRSQMK